MGGSFLPAQRKIFDNSGNNNDVYLKLCDFKEKLIRHVFEKIKANSWKIMINYSIPSGYFTHFLVQMAPKFECQYLLIDKW